MANILPKATFKDWSKDPKTAMLILMGSLLMFFVYEWVNSSRQNHSDCAKRAEEYRQMYLAERKEIDSFKMELLIRDRALGQISEAIDSLLRVKTKVPVNSILKETQ